jgi:hypothetical protein
VYLTDGDITRRDAVLWGYTLGECAPYLKHRKRELLFREAVIAFMTGGKEETPEDAYCEACKQSGKADCSTCTREIKTHDPAK